MAMIHWYLKNWDSTIRNALLVFLRCVLFSTFLYQKERKFGVISYYSSCSIFYLTYVILKLMIEKKPCKNSPIIVSNSGDFWFDAIRALIVLQWRVNELAQGEGHERKFRKKNKTTTTEILQNHKRNQYILKMSFMAHLRVYSV